MSGCLYDDDEVVTSSSAPSLGTATISDATAKEVFVNDWGKYHFRFYSLFVIMKKC